MPRPKTDYRPKLTPQDIAQVKLRLQREEKVSAIAERFGCSQKTIYNIRANNKQKYVDVEPAKRLRNK